MGLSYVDWVELESLVSQQRTVMHIKLSHFRSFIIMGLSYVDWVELNVGAEFFHFENSLR